MEHVPGKLICSHVFRLFLNFLSHGASMREQMDLCKLIEQFGDDENCRKAIENMRWPHGVHCPTCKSEKISRIVARNQFDCDSCRYQFSATAGTIFHDTHLPLHKWFLATYILCESKKGISALQMQRMLKTTYRTSWYLCHRIRAAMLETAPKKLGGTIEIDETYVGGKARRWRPKSDKQVVIGIRQRNGDLRLIRAKDAKSATVREIINANIGGHVEVIMTDESQIYPWALDKMQKNLHKTINHSKQYAHGDVHTNTVESAFSLLKRGIVGTWHKVSAKHLPAYLDEMCFRFNNRKNPYLFRDTLLKLIASPNIEYKQLTAKVQDEAA
jgi:transposase-like protein